MMCDSHPRHPYRPRASDEPYCLLCRPVLPSDHSARVFLGFCAFIFLVGGGGLMILRALVVGLSAILGGLLITAAAVFYVRWRRRMRLVRLVPAPVETRPRTMVQGVEVLSLPAAQNVSSPFTVRPMRDRRA